MNQRILKLMLEAGFAAPEIAGRARTLAKLIVEECANLIVNTESSEFAEFDKHDVARLIRDTFKDE